MESTGGIDLNAQVKVGKGMRDGASDPFNVREDSKAVDDILEMWGDEIKDTDNIDNDINELLKTDADDIINNNDDNENTGDNDEI